VPWLVAATVFAVLVLVVLTCFGVAPPPAPAAPPADGDFTAFMGVAAVMFVAFSGFERITAPLRGDPVHSARTLKVAIPLLIGLALGTTLAVAAAVQHQLGSARLALSSAPLRDALLAADGGWLVPLVQFGAVVAALAVLVPVLGGLRRTLGALASNGDLPTRLAGGRGTWLDVLGGASVAVVLLLVPPAAALAIGGCAILFYYAFTNASARVLLQEDRAWSMRTACLGLGLSVLLAMSAPVAALVTTVVVMGVGTALLGLCAQVGARLRARVVPAAESRTSDTRDGDFMMQE
jgi:APA family basic amino acid/polyamine antiporter